MPERSVQGNQAPSPARPSAGALLVVALIAPIVFWWMQRAHPRDTWAEDLPVYTQALQHWLAGHNPYGASLAPLYFLYPPAFLLLSGWISHLVPTHWGPVLYVCADVAALIALPLVLARYFFRQPWLSPVFALLLFFASPRFTGLQALRTMNIASAIYCLAFVAAIPGLRRNRWEWFYLAVFFAAIIKITFLALLLLPLLAGRRQWLRSILCGSAVILANLGERAFWPDLYRGYTRSLQQGIVDHQAFGYGVFGILANYHYWQKGIGAISYAAAGLEALALAGLMFFMRWRMDRTADADRDPAENGIWLALIVVTIVLVNPRQMQYDIDISVFAAFVLLVYAVKIQRLLTTMVLLFLPCLFVPLFVSNPRLQGGYEALLSLAAFALGYWRLNRQTAAQPSAVAHA